jgi:hypothetical protein
MSSIHKFASKYIKWVTLCQYRAGRGYLFFYYSGKISCAMITFDSSGAIFVA